MSNLHVHTNLFLGCQGLQTPAHCITCTCYLHAAMSLNVCRCKPQNQLFWELGHHSYSFENPGGTGDIRGHADRHHEVSGVACSGKQELLKSCFSFCFVSRVPRDYAAEGINKIRILRMMMEGSRLRIRNCLW